MGWDQNLWSPSEYPHAVGAHPKLIEEDRMAEAFRMTLILIHFLGVVAYIYPASMPMQLGSPIVHYSSWGIFPGV